MSDLEAAAKALRDVVEIGRPWIAAYGTWAVALGLFGETLVFSGVVVPGYGILVAAGYFVAAGDLPASVVALAWLAAAAGDQPSYLLGRRLGPRLPGCLRRHAPAVRSGLEADGRWMLLAYHFSPFLRALVPVVAGSTGYSARPWLLWDSLGLALWVPAVTTLGVLAHGALAGTGGVALRVLSVVALVITVAVTWRMNRWATARDNPRTE